MFIYFNKWRCKVCLHQQTMLCGRERYIKFRKLSIHTLLHFPFCRGLGYKRAFVPVGCHTIWLLKWLVRKTKPIIPRDRITAGVAQWLSFLFRVMDAQQLNFAALYVSSWAKYIWSTTIKKNVVIFSILSSRRPLTNWVFEVEI